MYSGIEGGFDSVVVVFGTPKPEPNNALICYRDNFEMFVVTNLELRPRQSGTRVSYQIPNFSTFRHFTRFLVF